MTTRLTAGQFPAHVDKTQDRRHHQRHDHDQYDRARRRRRILQAGELGRERGDDRRALTAAHDLDDEEIAHHQRDDEDRTERDAGLRQRQNDFGYDAPAAGAGVVRRLDEAGIDPGHRVEDRNDHEQGIEVHIGDDYRKIGEQQKRQRLVDDAEAHEAAVEDAVAPEERYPRNHPDDVRGPERHRADQEQSDLHGQASHVEHQEIGNREPDDERDGPDDRRIFDRAGIESQRQARFEQLDVIVEDEGRDDLQASVVVETDHGNEDHRYSEKYQEDERERRLLQPRHALRVDLHRFGWRVLAGKAARLCFAPPLANKIRRKRNRSTASPCNDPRP